MQIDGIHKKRQMKLLYSFMHFLYAVSAVLFSARACLEAAFVFQLNPVISWLGCGEDCLQTAAWHDQRESDTHAMYANTPRTRLCLPDIFLLIKC